MSDLYGNIPINPDYQEDDQQIASEPPQRRPSRKTERKGRPRRLWLWPLAGLLLLAVYSVTGFIGVPYYIERHLPGRFLNQDKAEFAADTIRFNPFTYRLNIANGSIRDETHRPLVRFDRLQLDFAPVPFLRMNLICKEVLLSGLALSVERKKDHSYDLAELFLPINGEDEGRAMLVFSELPFRFSLNNISVTDSAIDFSDASTGKRHRVENIQLKLPSLSNIAYAVENFIKPHFSAVINGSPVLLTGSARLDPESGLIASSQLSCKLDDVELLNYAQYLPMEMPFDVQRGKMDAELSITFHGEGSRQEKTVVDYSLVLKDLAGRFPRQNLAVEAPEIHIDGHYRPIQRRIEIQQCTADAAKIDYNGSSLTADLLSILPRARQVPGQLSAPLQNLHILIRAADISGSLKIASNAEKAAKPHIIEQLKVQLRNYATNPNAADLPEAQETASLSVSGQDQQKKGRFTYTGQIDSKASLSGELELQEIEASKVMALLFPGRKIESQGKGWLRSHITITPGKDRKAEFRYANLNLALQNLQLEESGRHFFSARRFTLKGGNLNLKKPDLGEITIEGGDIYWNNQKLPGLLSQPQGLGASLPHLAFQGRLQIQMASKAQPIQIQDCSLSITRQKDAESPGQIAIRGKIKSGGKIEANGDISSAPFKLSLSSRFTALGAQEAAAFLPGTTFLAKSTGKVSGSGNVTLPRFSFSGNFTHENGGLQRAGAAPLRWQKLSCENLHLRTDPSHLGIGRIQIDQLQTEVSIEKNTVPLSKALIEAIRQHLFHISIGPQKKDRKNALSPLDLQEIEINDATVTMNDQRMSPPWTGLATKVEGAIKDIHTTRSSQSSSFAFSGLLDGADFTWKGSFLPTEQGQKESSLLTLQGYPLRNIRTQLAADLSGLQVDSASVDLDLDSRFAGEKNQLLVRGVFTGLQTDNIQPELALVLAMLSREDGTYLIERQEESDLALTQNRTVLQDVTQALKTMELKAGLSPLFLVTKDYADLIDKEYVDFTPGEFTPTADGHKTMLRYQALLSDYPRIGLELSAGIDRNSDMASMQLQLEQYEKKRVELENEKRFAAWKARKEQYQRQVAEKAAQAQGGGAISETDIPEDLLTSFTPIQPEPMVVSDAMLLELAGKRLELVKERLGAGFSQDPPRIRIVPPQNTASAQGPSPGVKITIRPL
ncbi:MAG: hypothetical protein CSB23_04100 [Deltaproteobacteria bacterium]|nr:MAG: hypothetical protein CSB23_04100 [Deltaproteobacteria bacterium]